MVFFRFFEVSEKELVLRRWSGHFADDEAAISAACEACERYTIEVWDEARLVGKAIAIEDGTE